MSLFDPRDLLLRGRTPMHFGGRNFSVPYISEIESGLWQGGVSPSLVLPSCISHVVSVYPWESYQVHHDLKSNLQFIAEDSVSQDLSQFADLARWVNAARKTGDVLVHCAAGLNRSSVVTALSLMMLHDMTATEAIALLRKKRSPECLHNPAFEAWVREQGE